MPDANQDQWQSFPYLVFERVPPEECLAALAGERVEVVPEGLVPAHHAQLVALLPLRGLRIVRDILALLHDRSLDFTAARNECFVCSAAVAPLSAG